MTGYTKVTVKHLVALAARVRGPKVNASLGDGTVVYEGLAMEGHPQASVWAFTLYGGAVFCGDPLAPSEAITIIGAMTGPKAG